MKRVLATIAAALFGVTMLSIPSASAATVCYAAGVIVNGDAVVYEAGCQSVG